VSVSAHKIRGPKGIAALAFRGKAPEPILRGGSQERGLRPGTVDPVSVAGFRVALALTRRHREHFDRLRVLRDDFERSMSLHAVVNGGEPRLPHVTNLSFLGWRGDELVAALDLLGVSVSSGSACAAGSSEPSPVITSLLGAERAESAVRVSLGTETTAQDVERAKSAFFRVLGSSGGHASSTA
jgi:cysteine desulfurase